MAVTVFWDRSHRSVRFRKRREWSLFAISFITLSRTSLTFEPFQVCFCVGWGQILYPHTYTTRVRADEGKVRAVIDFVVV